MQLKKVAPAEERPAAAPQAGAPFVPNPADLLKLKAGLRKTVASPPAAEAQPEPESQQQPEPAVTAASAEEQPAAAEDGKAAPAAPAEPTGDGVAPMQAEAAEQPQEQPVAAAPVLDAAPAEPVPAAQPEQPAEAEAAIEQPAGDVAMADAPAEEAPAAPAAEAAAEPAAEPAELAAEADEQAKELAAAPASALRKRKSVRFHVDEAAAHHTPEGAARDATITIRLRKGDLEQVGVATSSDCHAGYWVGWSGVDVGGLCQSYSVLPPSSTTPSLPAACRSSTWTTTPWPLPSGAWAPWAPARRRCPTRWCPSAPVTPMRRPPVLARRQVGSVV